MVFQRRLSQADYDHTTKIIHNTILSLLVAMGQIYLSDYKGNDPFID